MPYYRYTLKLISSTGDFYLAPRPSVTVEESSDFEQLTSLDQKACNAGGCSTLEGERQFTFKLYINGAGSLDTAFKFMERLKAALQPACEGEEVLLFRRVYDETALVYKIKSDWSLRIVNVESQYDCDRVLTLEMRLTLTPAVQNQRTPSPVVMAITFPKPTVIVDTTAAISPVASTISFPAIAAINITLPVDPVELHVTFPTFTRDLGGVDVTAGSSAFMYIPAKRKLWRGEIDLDTHDIRSLLVMTSTTADTETDTEFLAGFTNLDEFNGAGYARVALTGEAVNQDTPNARAEFDADNIAFAALSNGTRSIAAIVLFRFVTNDADSMPICYLNFSSFNPGGSVLTCEWNAEGIFWQT